MPTLSASGDSGDKKTCAASGTLGKEATSGSILLLRYPLLTTCVYHICENRNAISQVKILVIALVAAAYPTRLVVSTDTLYLILWAVIGPLPGCHLL